ncbi:MAG: Hsp70 family protein, partial [Bacteroidota bacterium]
LFRLKRFRFDLSKAVAMRYRREFGLEPKEKKEKREPEGKEKKEGEEEETGAEAEEESPELSDEEVLSQIGAKIFRKDPESGEAEYRLEELYAMQLENLRENAESTGETRFTSAVMTIWDNDLSIKSRKQLADSMWLAGIKPLAFVHENTAAALKQSIDIKPDKDYEPEQVVYVN